MSHWRASAVDVEISRMELPCKRSSTIFLYTIQDVSILHVRTIPSIIFFFIHEMSIIYYVHSGRSDTTAIKGSHCLMGFL